MTCSDNEVQRNGELNIHKTKQIRKFTKACYLCCRCSWIDTLSHTKRGGKKKKNVRKINLFWASSFLSNLISFGNPTYLSYMEEYEVKNIVKMKCVKNEAILTAIVTLESSLSFLDVSS